MANISFDYDNTITEDLYGFIEVIKLLRNRGHRIYIITMRYTSEFISETKTFESMVDGIICTGRQSKRQAALQAGIKIDIWIDDEPRAINENANQIWGSASEEGTIINRNHQTGEDRVEKLN